MTRISSNLSGVDLTAQFNLAGAFARLNESNVRLATLRRVNSGRDDPAGLIAIETLQAELTALEQADRNAARAAGAVRVADSGLSQVSRLLNEVRGNVLEAAGGLLSSDEAAANQIEIDAALEAINRIGSTTSIGGRNLLDGSADAENGGQALSFLFAADPADAAELSLPTISTSHLGGSEGTLAELGSGGNAALASGRPADAIDALDRAAAEVGRARASAGAFERFTIDSSREVLAGASASVSAALSQIRDTDVAAETARQVRSQILVNAATAAVSLTSDRLRSVGSLLRPLF
jgi:flagellin-like hook-associated protein FlgL